MNGAEVRKMAIIGVLCLLAAVVCAACVMVNRR